MRRTVLVLLALLAVSGAVAGQATRLTLDANHALDSDEKQVQYQRTGEATAELVAPDMNITVAAEHDMCDIDGFHSDLRNDYLCIGYGEAIERSIRIYIPAEYWSPYVRETVEPVAGGVPATYQPVDGGQYTSVTVTLDEPGMYAWPVNAEAAYFAGAQDRTLENVEKVTGIGAPETEEWQYIPPSKLGGNQSAYVVRAPNGTDALVMEYQQSDGEWTTVPDEEKGYAPVYYQDTASEDQVYVFATDNTSAEVRYKTEATSVDELASAWREIASAGTRIEEIAGFDIPFIGS